MNVAEYAGYANMLTMECCSIQCHGQSSMCLVVQQQQICYGQLCFSSKHGRSMWLVV